MQYSTLNAHQTFTNVFDGARLQGTKLVEIMDEVGVLLSLEAYCDKDVEVVGGGEGFPLDNC